MSASLVCFPFESQTLQFMNENGLVNIYVVLLCYLFAPNNDPNEITLTEEDLQKVESYRQRSSDEVLAPS